MVDVSAAVTAVHQNHDYAHHPRGQYGTWHDIESRRNLELAGGFRHLRTIDSAPLQLTELGFAPNPWHWLAGWRLQARPLTKPFFDVWNFVQSYAWHPFLNLTRPVRHMLGLKQGGINAYMRSSYLRLRPGSMAESVTAGQGCTIPHIVPR